MVEELVDEWVASGWVGRQEILHVELVEEWDEPRGSLVLRWVLHKLEQGCREPRCNN